MEIVLNILSTKTDIGEKRLDRLLPLLDKLELKYIVHYGDITLEPLESANKAMKSIISKNKDKDFTIYMEDDAILSNTFNRTRIVDIIEYHQIYTDIVSLGSHSFGQFIPLTEDSVKLTSHMYGLQFVVFFKSSYNKVLAQELKVEQNRLIDTDGMEVRTVVPMEVKSDNLGGSQIKRFKQDEIWMHNRYEEMMIGKIKEVFCK